MKKLSTLIITSIIIILNVTGIILFLFLGGNEINHEIIIAFISYISVYISFFYLSEIQNGKLKFSESKYFVLFPIKKHKVIQKEIQILFTDIKYILILITTVTLLLIVSFYSSFHFFELFFSFIFILLFTSFLLVFLRGYIKFGKNITVIYSIVWLNFFITYIPLYFTANNYLNFTYDFISKYNPIGGLSLALFTYKNELFINTFLLILFLSVLLFLYKKAIKAWNI